MLTNDAFSGFVSSDIERFENGCEVLFYNIAILL